MRSALAFLVTALVAPALAAAAAWAAFFTAYVLWMWASVKLVGPLAGEPLVIGGWPAILLVFAVGIGVGVWTGNLVVSYARELGSPVLGLRPLACLAGASPLVLLAWLLAGVLGGRSV